MRHMHHNRGFHLLEILISLSIIAIISTWVLSNYQTFIASEHRREAEFALIALAGALETYALENGTYRDATLEKLKIAAVSADKTYQFGISAANDQHFIVTAQPLHQQAKNDIRCGALSLTSTGDKRSNGTADVVECW